MEESKPEIEKPQTPPIRYKLVDLISRITNTFSFLIMAFIAVFALICTCYTSSDSEKWFAYSVFGSYSIFGQLLVPILCALMLISVLFVLMKLCSSLSLNRVMVIASIASFLLQLIWIFGINTGNQYAFHDSDVLSRLAALVMNNDFSWAMGKDEYFTLKDPYSVSDESWYFVHVPFQCGGLFLFVAVFSLFGKYNYIAFQIINAIAGTISVVFVSKLTLLLTGKDGAAKMSAIILAGFLPFVFSSIFIYANSIAFAASLGAMLFCAKSYQARGNARLAYSILSIILHALAILIKPTFVLFLLANAFASMLYELRRGRPQYAVMVLVAMLVVSRASTIPTAIVESTADVEFGDGWGTLSYISMGLSDNPKDDSRPGYWNGKTMDLFVKSSGDKGKQNELAVTEIEKELSVFAQDPAYCSEFFLKKIAIEWLEPDYHTLWFSRLGLEEDSDSPMIQASASGTDINTSLTVFLDGMQLALYILAAGGFFLFLRKNQPFQFEQVLLSTVLIIGFGVYFLWESQGLYLLPFAVTTIPIAAGFASNLFDRSQQTQSAK